MESILGARVYSYGYIKDKGNYIYTMYKYIKIAMDKQHLIGAKGELGRWGTAPA